MADWTDSAMTACADRADAGWTDDEMTSCHDRVGLFAFGMDEDDHADTGTRSTSAGWSTIPLVACEDL